MSDKNLNSRQRAHLRSLAADTEPIFQIGKGGINDNMIKMIDDALEARELIKGSVLQSAGISAAEALFILCEKNGCGTRMCDGQKINALPRF